MQVQGHRTPPMCVSDPFFVNQQARVSGCRDRDTIKNSPSDMVGPMRRAAGAPMGMSCSSRLRHSHSPRSAAIVIDKMLTAHLHACQHMMRMHAI